MMVRCAGHGFDDVADEDAIAWQRVDGGPRFLGCW